MSMTDSILLHTKGNHVSLPKPVSARRIYYILPFICLVLLLLFSEWLSEKQTIILSIVASTIIAFFTLFITFSNEKRADYLSARKSAKILSDVLSSISSQILQISRGSRYPIISPENWLEYYAKCSIYLKYDYLESILREFEIVNNINNCIMSGNNEKTMSLIEYRTKRTLNAIGEDFDIYRISSNLSSFALGTGEPISWKQSKEYGEFLSFFNENYTIRVKELTLEYLNNHGGACDSDDAMHSVMEVLRKEAPLESGKYQTYGSSLINNKGMLNAIFKVYLTLSEEDDFALTWGQLNIRKKE